MLLVRPVKQGCGNRAITPQTNSKNMCRFQVQQQVPILLPPKISVGCSPASSRFLQQLHNRIGAKIKYTSSNKIPGLCESFVVVMHTYGVPYEIWHLGSSCLTTLCTVYHVEMHIAYTVQYKPLKHIFCWKK